MKKEKIKKYFIDYSPASSILNFFGNLLFAQKTNENIYYLREYKFLVNNSELDIECIGKGKDKTIEIPYIERINEKEIVTSNKSKFVKIWIRIEKKPEILQFDEFKKNWKRSISKIKKKRKKKKKKRAYFRNKKNIY